MSAVRARVPVGAALGSVVNDRLAQSLHLTPASPDVDASVLSPNDSASNVGSPTPAPVATGMPSRKLSSNSSLNRLRSRTTVSARRRISSIFNGTSKDQLPVEVGLSEDVLNPSGSTVVMGNSSASLTVAVKSGWVLWKTSIMTWKRCYISAKAKELTAGTLFFYRDDMEFKPFKQLDLTECVQVEARDFQKGSSNNRYEFKLLFRKHDLVLATESVDDTEAWCAILRTLIPRIVEPGLARMNQELEATQSHLTEAERERRRLAEENTSLHDRVAELEHRVETFTADDSHRARHHDQLVDAMTRRLEEAEREVARLRTTNAELSAKIRSTKSMQHAGTAATLDQIRDAVEALQAEEAALHTASADRVEAAVARVGDLVATTATRIVDDVRVEMQQMQVLVDKHADAAARAVGRDVTQAVEKTHAVLAKTLLLDIVAALQKQVAHTSKVDKDDFVKVIGKVVDEHARTRAQVDKLAAQLSNQDTVLDSTQRLVNGTKNQIVAVQSDVTNLGIDMAQLSTRVVEQADRVVDAVSGQVETSLQSVQDAIRTLDASHHKQLLQLENRVDSAAETATVPVLTAIENLPTSVLALTKPLHDTTMAIEAKLDTNPAVTAQLVHEQLRKELDALALRMAESNTEAHSVTQAALKDELFRVQSQVRAVLDAVTSAADRAQLAASRPMDPPTAQLPEQWLADQSAMASMLTKVSNTLSQLLGNLDQKVTKTHDADHRILLSIEERLDRLVASAEALKRNDGSHAIKITELLNVAEESKQTLAWLGRGAFRAAIETLEGKLDTVVRKLDAATAVVVSLTALPTPTTERTKSPGLESNASAASVESWLTASGESPSDADVAEIKAHVDALEAKRESLVAETTALLDLHRDLATQVAQKHGALTEIDAARQELEALVADFASFEQGAVVRVSSLVEEVRSLENQAQQMAV
ncbi:hypothetical protein GGF31_003924 [Allomyces arbusculus]|nr:hypothetical protein GGF31_003924 [Allomyces arbusculus]